MKKTAANSNRKPRKAKAAAKRKTPAAKQKNTKAKFVNRPAKPAKNTASAEPDFFALTENAVQAIFIHRNFKPLYANRACAALFGYKSVKEFLALPLIRPLIPEDRWPIVEAENDELIHGRMPSKITRARAIRKDGNEIWVAATLRAVDWPGGKAVEVTAFDITPQMDREQAFLENEQRLRSILEILPYPVYITRPDDGQLLFVNRKTCLLFQQSAVQLLKSRSVDFFADPKEREDLRQLMETIPDIRNIEVRMKTVRGREFTAELAGIAMSYDNAPAILVTLNDVSLRKEMEAKLFSQATTDELTGISNRRHFFMLAEREMGRAQRFGRPMSAMMVDIDHFKKINDTHGHALGDAVLQNFVQRSLESLRQLDVIGRLGGEEFAVIMPETNLAAAEAAAERLRQHIASRPLIADKAEIPTTVSIGVAFFGPQDTSIDHLLSRADKALYRAKHNGRNRVEIAE